MIKITRITTQKRKSNRYNIFIDDGTGEKYGFSVDEDILIKFRLQKGMELQEHKINELTQQDSKQKGYHQAIHYLSYRIRSKKEMYDYLMKKEVDEGHIQAIIERLESEKLIDDKQFADAFVKTRLNNSRKGPTLIKRELLDKGISGTIADEALFVFTYEKQYDKAYKLAEKRMGKKSKDSLSKQMLKIQAYLQRNGYKQEVITDVMAEIKENNEEHSDWEALLYHGERLKRRFSKKFQGDELRYKMKEGLYRQGFSLALIDRFLIDSQHSS